MNNDFIEVSGKGKLIKVPFVKVDERTVIVRGKWIRNASVHQEEWMEEEPVQDAENFVKKLKGQNLKADIFSFSYRLPETSQRYNYHFEWDNVAAIPIVNYDDWWTKRLSRKTRQEVQRAKRLGVTINQVPFDEKLIEDIVKLFNHIPIKQGMPFTHYGKDSARVRKDLSSYLNRSIFVGAYFGKELIGYVKIVFMGTNASILNIIADDLHFDKRPANALIAEAVKICDGKGIKYLQYGKYNYGNKLNSSLTEFKRRNGFQKIDLPRYYVPFTFRGGIVIRLGLHLGLIGLLPNSIINPLLNFRSGIYKRIIEPLKSIKGYSRNN
jgi:hypothetical protein